jgi:hypothetical protein
VTKAINGKRFLDSDRVTPALPLKRCDMSRCNCSYARYDATAGTGAD